MALGSIYPLLWGILIASGQLPENAVEQLEFIGELALDGHLRPTTGTLSIAIACQHAQHQLILPEQNAQEASQLPNFKVFCRTTFKRCSRPFKPNSGPAPICI